MFAYTLYGHEQRIKIGPYPSWTVEAARLEAKDLRKRVDRGDDPAQKRRDEREAPSVTELAQRYIEEHLPTKGERAQRDDKRYIDRHIKPVLGKRRVKDIHMADAAAFHRDIPNEIQAGVDHVNALTKNADVVPDYSGGLGNALKKDAPKPLTGDDISKQLYAISQSSDEAWQKISKLNQLYAEGLITAQSYDSAVQQALTAVTQLGQFNLDDVLGNSTRSYADKVDALNDAWKRGIITFQQYKQNMKSVADENEQNMNTILSTTGSTLSQLFQQSKGAAIANALINTYEGITAALKLPFPLNWVQSGLVAAAGFAQVANIRSQQQGAAGGNGASAASASAAAASAQPVATAAPTQTLEVIGINPNSLFSGGAVRGLVQQLIKYQQNGGKIVLA